MTEKTTELELIDFEFFESRRQVGDDFVQKLIQVFSQEAPKLVQKIKATAKEDRPSELAELGHKLKGMCLNVGAQRLSALGKEIELSAKSGEGRSLNQFIKHLDNVLEETLSEMEKLG